MLFVGRVGDLMVEVNVPACERAPMEGDRGHPAGGRRFVPGDDAIAVRRVILAARGERVVCVWAPT